jgi:hypothetical protein
MNDAVSRLHDYECDGSYENTTGQYGKYLYSIQLSLICYDTLHSWANLE